MNLEQQYKKVKNGEGQIAVTVFLSVVVAIAIAYGMNLLWNYLAPIWGLPQLTYVQFLGSLLLINLLKQFLGIKHAQ